MPCATIQGFGPFLQGPRHGGAAQAFLYRLLGRRIRPPAPRRDRDLKPRNMLVLARRTRAASLTPGATPDRRRRLRREGPPSACFTFDDGLKRLVDSLPALRGHTITDG